MNLEAKNIDKPQSQPLLIAVVISRFFKDLRWKLTSRTICDNCGKVNPKILKTKSGYSRYTQCCAYSENQSAGKTMTERLKFPIVYYWSGFWS